MPASDQRYRYSLVVIDNFHLGDPDEGDEYEVGPFMSCEAALKHARGLIDEFAVGHTTGKTAEEHYRNWAQFGETPILVTDDPDCHFRATDYARQRFAEISNVNDRSE